MPVLGAIKETVCLMPIVKMISSLAEIPDFYQSMFDNIKERNDTKIRSILDGARWKKIIQKFPPESAVIPIELYVDDFEPDNALGSNAGSNKISGYYLSFPALPSHFQSTTKYIFEALLHQSHLKNEDFASCTFQLIEVFKELENGIIINVGQVDKKVHFILIRILGDNLGINEILGFTKSFNSKYFCRFCNITKEESKGISPPSSSRTVLQYENDLRQNNVKETGVREKCQFNQLEHFHCVENFTCDIMHDLFEGIIKYDLSKTLKVLIDDKTVLDFNLETLNTLKQSFDYGQIEIGNLSNPIQFEQLKNGTLKMSASEARNFLHFLPLMIGHLIPKENIHWKFILKLIDICDIAMKSSFDDDDIKKMEMKISAYLKLYVELYGRSLKPKHHFLCHYADCIRQNGPLR